MCVVRAWCVARAQHKVAEYTALKQQAQAAGRRTAGSLAVKDPQALLGDGDIVDTENLMTAVAVVPQARLPTNLCSCSTPDTCSWTC